MFEIDIQREFSAAHCLRGYHGNCAELHGHNWQVQIVVQTGELDDIGIAVDFRYLRTALDAVLAEFDHKDLGILPCFQEINPTSESLAMIIHQRLAPQIAEHGCSLARVRVCESPGSGATYLPDA